MLIGLCALGMAAVLLAYVHLAPVTERNIAEFDAHGVKNAWTVFGVTAGMLLAWWVDDRYTRFDTHAVWWVQITKLVLGLLPVVGVKSGLKPVFSLLGTSPFLDGLRYFLMAVVGGVLWPMSFRFWTRRSSLAHAEA